MNDAERGIEEWRELHRMVEAAFDDPEMGPDRRARLQLTEKPPSGGRYRRRPRWRTFRRLSSARSHQTHALNPICSCPCMGTMPAEFA